MKLKVRNLVACAAFLLPAVSLAGHNPAVQPIFFEELAQALPASQPQPISVDSSALFDVTWAGLAWAVDNVKRTHVPLIIEFYSADANDCIRFNPVGTDECSPQVPTILDTAVHYSGRVDVVRFNVQQHPQVLNGPDVRVLPTHIFIADYSDTQHYTAIKIWGLIDEQGLQQTIQQTFKLNP
jgi:thioredoxin-like negative regulator of GroEL